MPSFTSELEVKALAERVYQRILAAAEEAVSETVERGTKYAKRLAPVRKVSFTTRNATPRLLTAVERRKLPSFVTRDLSRTQIASLKTTDSRRRAQQELPAPEIVEERPTVTRGGQVVVSKRVAGTGFFRLAEPSNKRLLSSRGHDELGRRDANSAIYQHAGKATAGEGRTTLGGRLRGEITSQPVSRRGGRIRYDIISPTRYAKFVEFPTTRTAAQPYMRPTLAAMKRPFVDKMRRNLSNVARYGRG